MPAVRILLALLLIIGAAPQARASDGCAGPADGPAASAAQRIAAVACAEHALWHAPFIDEQGRLASIRVSEAEGLRLSDGRTPAWQRVAQYWQGSGVRWPADDLDAGADCSGARGGAATALCRSFLVDTPWSAVFVSWVMARAGVVGFRASPRHVDFVRDAHRGGAAAPYRLLDPDAEAPATGDLLCYARMPGQVFGAAGFRRWLAATPAGPLAMHCDIVVSTAGQRARLVGGNVLQGVTMRLLPLNRSGRLWGLPRRGVNEPACNPGNPQACSLNRHDWVALLRLTPAAAISVPAMSPRATDALAPACCEVCTLPLPAGMRRCASPPPVVPLPPPPQVTPRP